MGYMDILYNEYIETLNTRTTEKKEKENFYYWLEENKKILRLYELFLQSLDMTPFKGVVELNKHINDSILLYTPFNTKGIIVSPYTKTEKINNNVVTVNGKISFDKRKVYRNGFNIIKVVPIVLYNKKTADIDEILNYTTHFPIKTETLNTMKELIKIDKNVFIGLYGRLEDKNKMEKLKKLYNIKNELQDELNKDFVGECIETKDYYFAAITPKIKFKNKNKIIMREGYYGSRN